MRGHVDITKQIFGGQIEETIQNIALRHHEKLDGSGYPLELKGEDLTIGERIVAVADIVSALSGTRSYKNAYSKERVQTVSYTHLDVYKRQKLKIVFHKVFISLALYSYIAVTFVKHYNRRIWYTVVM